MMALNCLCDCKSTKVLFINEIIVFLGKSLNKKVYSYEKVTIFECKVTWWCSYMSVLQSIREDERAWQGYTEVGNKVWSVYLFLKVGRKQRKEKRGFVPFLFLHDSSYEGAHHWSIRVPRSHKETWDCIGIWAERFYFVALRTSGKF